MRDRCGRPLRGAGRRLFGDSRPPGLGQLDDEIALIVLRDFGDGLRPSGAVRLEVVGGKIVRIADFFRCPWIIEAAASVAIETA